MKAMPTFEEGPPCASCGKPMFVTTTGAHLVSTVHHVCERSPERMLSWLLNRIGSQTDARFDQHLRHEFGDEATKELLAWLKKHGVKGLRTR
jgi:hypothetical protein